jgi:hypothetical protein
MLCFDAWLHLPNYWTEDKEEESQDVVTKAIKKLMQMCKSRIPSISSTKWNFPKFHELLHIVKDISRFGAVSKEATPQGIGISGQVNLYIRWVKKTLLASVPRTN